MTVFNLIHVIDQKTTFDKASIRETTLDKTTSDKAQDFKSKPFQTRLVFSLPVVGVNEIEECL